jgi:hypothetical protein
MVSYDVPDFRLALNLGSHYLPGYFGMHLDRAKDSPAFLHVRFGPSQ